jgi:hypothetical protein
MSDKKSAEKKTEGQSITGIVNAGGKNTFNNVAVGDGAVVVNTGNDKKKR